MLAYPLFNMTNLWVKLSRRNYFPGECEIAKPKPLFKKGSKTNPKTADLFLPLASKIIDKSIKHQLQDSLTREWFTLQKPIRF